MSAANRRHEANAGGKPEMGGRPEMRSRPDMGGRPMMGGRPDMGGRPMMMGGRFTGSQKPKNMRATAVRLWGMFGKQKSRLLIIFLLATIGSGLGLIGPWLIGRGVDAIDSPGGVDFARLARILAMMGGAYGAGALMSWIQEWWIAGVAQRVVLLIRRSVFASLQRKSLAFFDTRTHGELMSRLSYDVDSVSGMISSSTTQLFSSVLMIIGSLTMMLIQSPPLTALALLTVPPTLLLSSRLAKRSRVLFKQQQSDLASLNGHVEEILSGQEVVKAFGQEDRVTAQFDSINGQLRESGRKAQFISGLLMPQLNALTNVGFIIVAAAGGYLALYGYISVGVIASFLTYSKQFTRPLNEIANLYSTIQSAQAGAERIFELIDLPGESADLPDARVLANRQGRIDFEDVDFGYRPDHLVLRDIALNAEPGQAIALVGPTGAGKTTIVNLLVRFYDPASGTIRFDGSDLRTITRDSLRASYGMVLQDTHLFSGSVRENLRYGRLDASDEEIEEAARIVGAETFIRRMPQGYETELGESGGGLSQGQRQLLAIARAILAEPAVLILDEATSSVDTRTEMLLQQAMLGLRKGRTSFIIAHRLSTIRDADRILVIDDGSIIEQGSHRELMAAGGFYSRMYRNLDLG